jgi:hypothetical protein
MLGWSSVPEQVVHSGQVEVELPHVLGLELPGLELDDDVAAKLQVVEEEVDPELLRPHLERHLAPDEREPLAELEQEVSDVPHEPLLDHALLGVFGDAEEVELVGVLERLAREVRLGAAGSVAAKFVLAPPWASNSSRSMWITSTFRLQPLSTAFRAYQSRSRRS